MERIVARTRIHIGAAVPAAAARLLSLDAFRGATIAGMVLVNNAGEWTHVYAPLRHAEWHGWTATDLVFPFFLWIMGVAMVYSFAARRRGGEDTAGLLARVARRAGTLFALGLFLNAFPHFDLGTLRIPGVLQRIGLCYLAAGVIFLFSETRGRLLWIGGLLAGYWALMKLYPVPGYGAGVLDLPGNFAQYVDGLVLKGHLYRNQLLWDPEGIVSTLPAIANTLFGVLCGTLLRSEGEAAEKTRSMIVYGSGLVTAGLICGRWLPINKNLWTSSYALFSSGLAFWGLAACYWLVDVRGWRRWVGPLVTFGINAIAIYVASGLLSRLLGLAGWKAPAYEALLGITGDGKMASLAYAMSHVLAMYALAWLMQRRGWMVRI
jgi:predicted acyltransferase